MKGNVYTMTEVNKMIVIQSVVDNKRTGKEASEALKLSERQIWRLVKKVKEGGIDKIKHGNHARTPKNKIPNDVEEKIVKLKKRELFQGTEGFL